MNTDYTTKENLWITEWTNPTTGEVRYYLNDWEEDVAGVEVYRRKGGSISEFYIRDEKIANSRHGSFGGKIWVSEAGEVTVELSRAYYETAGVDGDAIEADLREAARQLWGAKYAPAQEEVVEEAPAVELVPSEDPIHEATLRHPRFLSLSGNVTADGENLPGTRIAWKSDEESLQMKPLEDGTWEVTERVITDHATQRHGQVVATKILLPGKVDKALNEWLDR